MKCYSVTYNGFGFLNSRTAVFLDKNEVVKFSERDYTDNAWVYIEKMGGLYEA